MQYEHSFRAAEPRAARERRPAVQTPVQAPRRGSVATARSRALRVAALSLTALFLSGPAAADRDDDVSVRAKQALVSAGLPGANDIAVTSFNGEVELSGSVRSEHVREEAARLVGAVRGVTAVRNSLSARQPSGDRDADDVISDLVRAALITAGIADARNITVRTFNGAVELSGIVSSDDIRATAMRVAGEVRGVNAVRDSLAVQRP